MFKLAAVTAVAAASKVDDFKETAEMFKIRVYQDEMHPFVVRAKELKREAIKYDQQMQASPHGKQFQTEVHALVKSDEFGDLVRFVKQVKEKGPTEQIKKFQQVYMAQVHRVMKAHQHLEQTTKRTLLGKAPHHRGIIDVDDDAWIQFNREYYKLREMEYYAAYKIPEMKGIRHFMRDLKDSKEMGAIQTHWKVITMQNQHQVVVHHQAELVMAATKVIHLDDEKWLDPAHSPVMFDAWHMVYIYFQAMAHGDLEPIFDFIIDGKYADEFVDHVNPQFSSPENYPEDLYLY